MTIKRMNWGCGSNPAPGWINSDQKTGPGIDISCDIRNGLPLPRDSIAYIASIHALAVIAFPDIALFLPHLMRT